MAGNGLAGGLMLVGSGLLGAGALEWNWWGRGDGQFGSSGGLAAALVWLNLLFLLVPLWSRHGRLLVRWLILAAGRIGCATVLDTVRDTGLVTRSAAIGGKPAACSMGWRIPAGAFFLVAEQVGATVGGDGGPCLRLRPEPGTACVIDRVRGVATRDSA